MIRPQDITRGFRAVLAMSRRDPEWQNILDSSEEGIFKSFWAMPLSIPLIIIYQEITASLAHKMGIITFELPLTGRIAGLVIPAMVAWIIGLVAIGKLARMSPLKNRFAYFLVSYNWCSLLSFAIQCASAVFFGVVLYYGLDLSAQASIVAQVGANLVTIYLFWRVIRMSLQTNRRTSLGIIAMLTLISVAIGYLFAAIGLTPYTMSL